MIKRCLATVAMLAACATTLMPSGPLDLAAPASAAEAARCKPVALIGLRGSGEDQVQTDPGVAMVSQGYSSLRTGGSEGPTILRALQALDLSAALSDQELSGVPVIEVGEAQGYKAIPAFEWARLFGASVDPTVNEMKAVLESARSGANAALATMNAFRARQPVGCGVTHFILAGYSQGAMAAHLAQLGDPTEGRIAGIMTVGDPFHYPDASNGDHHGAGANGTGIFVSLQRHFGSLDGLDFAKFNTNPSLERFSLCHFNDPFCDYHALQGDVVIAQEPTEHLNYLKSDREEIRAAGDWLSGQISRLSSGFPTSNPYVPHPVMHSPVAMQVMLAIEVIDAPQASDPIQEALLVAAKINQRAVATEASVRFGIVAYGTEDPDGSVKPTHLISPPVLDYASLRSALDEISAFQPKSKKAAMLAAGLEASASPGWDASSHHATIFVSTSADSYTASPYLKNGLIRVACGEGGPNTPRTQPMSFYGIANEYLLASAAWEIANSRGYGDACPASEGTAFYESSHYGTIPNAAQATGLAGASVGAERIATQLMSAPRIRASIERDALSGMHRGAWTSVSLGSSAEGTVTCLAEQVRSDGGLTRKQLEVRLPSAATSCDWWGLSSALGEWKLSVRVTSASGAMQVDRVVTYDS